MVSQIGTKWPRSFEYRLGYLDVGAAVFISTS